MLSMPFYIGGNAGLENDPDDVIWCLAEELVLKSIQLGPYI